MNAADFQPGPLAEVSSRAEADGRWTLTLVRDLPHRPEQVWAVLTEPARLGAWAPYTADRDLAATGPATLTMVDGQTPTDLPATVTRADAPHVLAHTWGEDSVLWELQPTPPGTRLTLSQTVEGPQWLAQVAAGWHLCLVVAARLLDGDPIPPIVGRAAMDYGWEDLRDAYSVRLGTGHDGTAAG
ncbi:SRPBCC family protein [Georgenia yuyongxinii]|uniref:SRPBCC family protein n=1 Tax=Georgenia yuyongxinii TaxID=2589797 RepID=A0A5B8C388_9MICO|nr:SRPBCC family protein [Georgenia yuyongxinii]QDC25043.1 SRPBCC family protein [Georgenia yuyongxinii]